MFRSETIYLIYQIEVCQHMNERKTENIFRQLMAVAGMTDNDNIIIEEQKSDSPKIDKLLIGASKSGKGKGYPEFIIRKKGNDNLIIVVECKANTLHQRSANLDKYADYAMDGAILYGSYLNREYDVVCIGFSGQTEAESKLDTMFFPKGASEPVDLIDPRTDSNIRDVLSFDDYDLICNHNPEKEKLELTKVMQFADKLHNYMRDNIGLTEEQKPLVVSAIMLAIQDEFFHFEKDGDRLVKDMIESIEATLAGGKIPDAKVANLLDTFLFIRSHEGLQKINKDGVSNLKHCIIEVNTYLKPFMQDYVAHDIIGKFYGEFISYTGGDGKGLGVVLTPKYITDLMCDLLQVNEDSVILDTCTGTGAFLIAAMGKMNALVNKKYEVKAEREEKLDNIKKNQLVGVENLSNMYAMACANMIFRGDGKANLFKGSCFNYEDDIKAMKPTIALINPPYAQKGDGLQEIDFIHFTLDCLEIGGKLAAIVPMNVAIDIKKGRVEKRESILKSHRLDAVLSMNDQVFEPYASTVTCIMIFTAHTPHDVNEYHKTFFGYFKDDGWFSTRKGRVDSGKWESIKNNWLDKYFNKQSVAGLSVTQKVDFNDEWCAEAYMETDYSKLTDDDFIKSIKEYAAFKMLNSDLFEV